MKEINLLVNLFFALWIRQILISRKYEKIIFKYYNKYGFLRNDSEVFKVLDTLEEREERKNMIRSKIKRFKLLFKGRF